MRGFVQRMIVEIGDESVYPLFWFTLYIDSEITRESHIEYIYKILVKFTGIFNRKK